MAKYSNTKAKINEKITTNSAQTITGNILNYVLQTMVDSLGADYQFGGLVQPGSTFTAGEQPVVFLATTPGTYTNFGGLVVADGEVALLVWSGTAWSKQTPDIATRTEVSQLGQKVDEDAIRATAFNSVQNIDLSGTTTGAFWRNGGQQEANSNWKSISLDCRTYTGKYIRVRAGYNNPSYGLNTLVAFCFVKKTNDSYTALVEYVVGFENDYAAIVKLPTDAKGLDLSWNFNDSGMVLPLCGITLVDSIKYADNNITLPNTYNTIVETLMDKSLEVNQQLTAVNTYIDRALYSDGVMRYASGYSVGQYNVTSIKRVIIDGYQGDGGYLLAQVTDSSDKTTCMWALGARGAMTNYQLLLPSGSKYLFVTHYGSSSVSSLKDSYKGTNILENIKSINSSVLAIEATELGKYWQSGDTTSSNENWAYTTIDLSQFRGKALRVRGGYLNSTDYSTWLLYSFIKRTNNQFIALSEVSPKLQLDGCWIVRIPQDAVELQLSWAYKDAGGKVMPLVQYEPSDDLVLLDDSHLQDIDANPLSTVIRTPSYTGIIHEWGFIGDSLSSGAMECYEGSQVKYIDMYEYSWCQRMCQLNNVTGYNFTQGGQTTKGWITGATARTWDADGSHNGASANLKKGYCIYLGTNDSYVYTTDTQIGTTADINTSDYLLNEDTFVGNYAGIIQRIKSVQPKAKIFCITCLRNLTKFNTQIRNIVTFFQSVYPDDIYLVDLMKYVPISLAYTNNGYNLNGHNSALGYEYVAYCVNTYIDWIIRNNKLAFKGVSLIGTDYTEEPLTD